MNRNYQCPSRARMPRRFNFSTAETVPMSLARADATVARQSSMNRRGSVPRARGCHFVAAHFVRGLNLCPSRARMPPDFPTVGSQVIRPVFVELSEDGSPDSVVPQVVVLLFFTLEAFLLPFAALLRPHFVDGLNSASLPALLCDVFSCPTTCGASKPVSRARADATLAADNKKTPTHGRGRWVE